MVAAKRIDKDRLSRDMSRKLLLELKRMKDRCCRKAIAFLFYLRNQTTKVPKKAPDFFHYLTFYVAIIMAKCFCDNPKIL